MKAKIETERKFNTTRNKEGNVTQKISYRKSL